MRMLSTLLLPLSLVLVTACESPRGYGSPPDYELGLADYDALAQQKASLWELGLEPKEFEFEGHGKVTVSNWELAGWPGNVSVTARVRYTNTTDVPVIHAIVWLEVLDAEGNVAGSTGVRLNNPLGYPMWPGSSYSLEVRTPTNGAHLQDWTWGIACKVLPDDDPGAKPALVVTRDRLADGQAPGQVWRRLPVSSNSYRGSYYTHQFRGQNFDHVPGGNPSR